MKNIEDKIKKFCYDRQDEMVKFLQKLIVLSSEAENKGQKEIIKFLSYEIRRRGLKCTVHGKEESSAIQATFGNHENGILLNCSLDTAPAGDINKWSYNPYKGSITADGRMYGRGSADCKSGIIAMLFAVLSLRGSVDENKIRVELVFDRGVKKGKFLGMKKLVDKDVLDKVKAGIIGYGGTSTELAIGARGYHRFTLVTQGKAEHTGNRSEYNINAIESMVELITEIKKIKFKKSMNKHFYFGSKVTFTQIEGGKAINIVPDICKAKIDVRTIPEIQREDIEQSISHAIKNFKKKYNYILPVHCAYNMGEEAYVLNENEYIIKAALKSINKITRVKPAIVVNGPAHIGNLLYRKKIPMVVFGPEGGNVHKYDEYVEIDSIPRTAQIYANVILRYFDLL